MVVSLFVANYAAIEAYLILNTLAPYILVESMGNVTCSVYVYAHVYQCTCVYVCVEDRTASEVTLWDRVSLAWSISDRLLAV